MGNRVEVLEAEGTRSLGVLTFLRVPMKGELVVIDDSQWMVEEVEHYPYGGSVIAGDVGARVYVIPVEAF